MICKHCGAQVADELSFCTNCGANITVPEPVESAPEPPVQKQKPSVSDIFYHITKHICANVRLCSINNFFTCTIPCKNL